MANTKEDKSFWETWLKLPDWEDIKDPIYGLAKGALLGGLTGGPTGAVAGGYLGAESGSRKRRGEIDQLAAKKAGESDLDRVAQQYYADAMGGASAIGQQMGQSFNRRGLGGSPLAAGIQSQAMNQALGRAQAEVAKMRLGYMDQQDAIKRQEQMQSDQMFYQLLSTILGGVGTVAGLALGGPLGGAAGGALGGAASNLLTPKASSELTPLGNRLMMNDYRYPLGGGVT